MNTSVTCVACMINKAEKATRKYKDIEKNNEFMHEVLKLLYDYAQTKSTAWITVQVSDLLEKYYGEKEDYTEVKHLYNKLMLEKEEYIEKRMLASKNPLESAILYACAGNYIDFGAMASVEKNALSEILDKVDTQQVDEKSLKRFVDDLENAKELVYLTDNCGEIVMDKIFIRYLKSKYPKLQITVILRGENVINDATLEDAMETGLMKEAKCIGNGTRYPGTVLSELSEEAKECLEKADVIISKGQGNFESLYGEKINPYFLFLCKCELFVRKFHLERFSPVFIKEDDIVDTSI